MKNGLNTSYVCGIVTGILLAVLTISLMSCSKKSVGYTRKYENDSLVHELNIFTFHKHYLTQANMERIINFDLLYFGDSARYENYSMWDKEHTFKLDTLNRCITFRGKKKMVKYCK